MDDAIVLFTKQSVEKVLRDGGSGRWRLVPSHARQRKFVVLTRNAKNPKVEGPEPHRSAFLVGKIGDIVPSTEKPGRYWIKFREYARLGLPEAWNKGDRNPVRYSKLEDLSIDPSKLKWEPMPNSSNPDLMPKSAQHGKALTIAEAKEGLSMTFGVPAEAIEITIRG